jgi:hypothetical protein
MSLGIASSNLDSPSKVSSAAKNTPLLLIGQKINTSGIIGAATEYLSFCIPAGAQIGVANRFKLIFNVDTASGVNPLIFLNMVARLTLPDDLTFTYTTPITIGGISNPTFTSGGDYTSEPFNIKIDGTHDTYIFLRINPASSGASSYSVYDEQMLKFCSADLNSAGAHYDTDAALGASIRINLSAQSVGIRNLKVA